MTWAFPSLKYICRMKIHPTSQIVILWSAFAIIIACNPDKTETLAPEADTRLWVKEAFTKKDIMQMPTLFNHERAVIIQTRLQAETDPIKKMNLTGEYAMELLSCGKYSESISMLDTIYKFFADYNATMDPVTKRNLYSLVGIAYMRQGEVENCLQNHNQESCLIPIQPKGFHQLTTGSRKAIEVYEQCLKEFPEDLETIYLLNLAYMTLGEYPNRVPKKYLIDPSWFKSKIDFPRYPDIAAQLGVNRFSNAGGTVIDDFNNDGWLDIVVSSLAPTEELVLYLNNGDGTFSDRTEEFGLKGHVAILNFNQTDYNNDGWLDLFLMRGAWFNSQGDMPCTLLKNTGKGFFVDVTMKAGLTKYASSQTSAWADYNLDGWLDLIKANESMPNLQRGVDVYINQKDGTFSHESAGYGMTTNLFFKGCVAPDVNNDRYPDLFLSPIGAPNLLYINQGATGKKGFMLSGPGANLSAPEKSFPCWSFDYDNDGHEDIFVSSYSNDVPPAAQWMMSHMGTADPALFPKLYHNKGNLQFEEVGVQMGLTEIAFSMGCNFGDINSDGFLDFYMATGNPLYQSIVPNKMYLNMEGKRFEDISYSGGFANIQKGHGVGFGDLDQDGDEDLYVTIGGTYDGDKFYNSLFENPNPEQNNWIVLKLEGTTANKAAIGARVTLTVMEEGVVRKICRTVTSGASFGGNSLVLEVGLRKAMEVKSVHVQWPCKECPDQVFTGMAINKAYTLTQDNPTPTPREYSAVQFGKHQAEGPHKHH